MEVARAKAQSVNSLNNGLLFKEGVAKYGEPASNFIFNFFVLIENRIILMLNNNFMEQDVRTSCSSLSSPYLDYLHC